MNSSRAISRRRLRLVWASIVLVGVAACDKEKTFDPPDRQERVAEADALFQEVRFDTIEWESADARALEGNAVYAAECRKCHGTLGSGGTAYAESRDLKVPSLIEADWRLAASIDSVRHRVFVGHAPWMPTWGVAGISVREIDAVAYYLLESLRPEILDGDGHDGG
jgi:mono/diheme cytochrome c family protein